MEQLKTFLARLPILAVAVLYCGWLGYDYYDWITSPQSELGQKKTALVAAKLDLADSKKKLAAGQEFFAHLDLIRNRIRQLTGKLDETKATLSADIDIGNLIKLVPLEAKKLGLVIKGINPEAEKKRDYYIEAPFTVGFRGAYVQLLVFFDKIAKFNQIIRIGDFYMKPSGNIQNKYVELDGTVQLIAYKYIGTHADEVINKDEMKSNDMAPKSIPKNSLRATPVPSAGGGK